MLKYHFYQRNKAENWKSLNVPITSLNAPKLFFIYTQKHYIFLILKKNDYLINYSSIKATRYWYLVFEGF